MWGPRLDLSSLNPQQREAALHNEGPMLVLAGAGSGKTRVIISRIARLILEGTPPEKILGVTFTNKAAREMRGRLKGVLGRSGAADKVSLSTFHALGLEMVKKDFRVVGLGERFCIYDTSDQLGLVRELLRRTKVADRRLDVPRVLELIQKAKKRGLDEVPIETGDDYELAAHLLYPKYVEQMQAFQAVDFDDLLLHARKILLHPEAGPRWQTRFRYILVDEYQDTSPEQLELIQLLGKGGNVFVVGDDDQSIYAWRGARARNILDFGKHFPGAKEVILDQNYRSVNAVLETANKVIACNTERKEKTLWSDLGSGDPVRLSAVDNPEEEALTVANAIHTLKHQGQDLGEVAVLYRSNLQSRILEETLGLEGIPFEVFGGQAFYERKEVKDAIAYLQVAYNPYNELALRRIINTPARGIGPTTIRRLEAAAGDKPLWAAVKSHRYVPELTGAARRGLESFAALINQWGGPLRSLNADNASPKVSEFLDSAGLREAIHKADDAPAITERRLGHLRQVGKGIGRFAARVTKGNILGEYLRNAALEPSDEAEGERESKVSLMTIHASKGLEFDVVFLVGMEEEILPHKKTIDEGGDIAEERRLAYVAITRARSRLQISYTRHRPYRGALRPVTPSRFIAEMGEGPHLVDAALATSEAESASIAESAMQSIRERLGLEL